MAPSTPANYENEKICFIVPFGTILFHGPNNAGRYCKPDKKTSDLHMGRPNGGYL